MEDQKKTTEPPASLPDVRAIVQTALREFAEMEQSKSEPAYKTELVEERKRREKLEQRVNELIEENRRSRQAAEEADRSASIRAELQRLGVSKVDLAYKAIRDDIHRTEDGRLLARTGEGDTDMRGFLARFVSENPEFLPARMSGGSGTPPISRPGSTPSGVDLDKIRPGMSREELQRVREEIARVASQAMRGL